MPLRKLALYLLGTSLSLLLSAKGCGGTATQRLTPDQLLPPNAVRAEIPVALGANHSEPRGHYLWTQGFKHEGTFEEVVAEIKLLAEPHGYRLENHQRYVDTLGDTGIPNREILRIFRGNGVSFSLFFFRPTSHYSTDSADFAIMMRDY